MIESLGGKKLDRLNNKERQLFIGVIVSILSFGLFYILYTVFIEKHKMKGQQVLKSVKSTFKEQGPIDGSWINMTAGTYDHYDDVIEVYYGGITRTEQGEQVQYEFIADAYTGDILRTSKI